MGLDSPARAVFDHSPEAPPMVWPNAGVKAAGASSVSGHPVMGGNGPRGPGGKLGVCRSLGVWGLGKRGLGFRIWGLGV